MNWSVSRLGNCTEISCLIFYGTCGTVLSPSLIFSHFLSFSLISLISLPPFLSSLTCWSEFLRNSWNASWETELKTNWPVTIYGQPAHSHSVYVHHISTHEIDIKLDEQRRQRGSAHSLLLKTRGLNCSIKFHQLLDLFISTPSSIDFFFSKLSFFCLFSPPPIRVSKIITPPRNRNKKIFSNSFRSWSCSISGGWISSLSLFHLIHTN